MKAMIAPLLLAAGLWGQTAATAQENDALAALMATMANVTQVAATFEEQKRLAVLTTPLRYSGQLRYRAPDWLLKESFAPYPSRFELDGDWITLTQPDGQRRQLRLRGYQELQPLVAALRATLAGDLAELRRHFALTFTGDDKQWSLTLQPLAGANEVVPAQIVLSGHGDALTRLAITEANGDHSELVILQTELQRRGDETP